jgi:hypothetical protein
MHDHDDDDGGGTQRELSPAQRLAAKLGCIVVVWSVTGMLWYHYVEGWSLSGSMFYATNVGLGVGFGLYNLQSVWSKWFTSFYCLIGSSFVGAAGGLCVQYFVSRSDVIFEEERVELLAEQANLSPRKRGQNLRGLTKFSGWEYLMRKHKYRLRLIGIFICVIVAGMGFAMMGNLNCPTETIPAPRLCSASEKWIEDACCTPGRLCVSADVSQLLDRSTAAPDCCVRGFGLCCQEFANRCAWSCTQQGHVVIIVWGAYRPPPAAVTSGTTAATSATAQPRLSSSPSRPSPPLARLGRSKSRARHGECSRTEHRLLIILPTTSSSHI